MMEYRERGLRQIRDQDLDDPFLFCECSPPEDADRDDPDTWAWSNPALGRTITVGVIEAEHKDPDTRAFDRATLNRWVRSIDSWLRPGLWAAGITDVEPERTPDVVAVETDKDFRGFGAVSAWSSDEGDACLVRSFATADPKPLWAHLGELHEAGAQVLLVPSLFERHPWSDGAEHVTRVGSKELERWMPQVTALAEAAAIGHDGDHELAEHVTRAAAVTSSRTGDQTLSAARSPGPIYLARAVAFAVGAATKPRQQLPAPVIYVRGGNGRLRGGDLSKPSHVAAVG